MTSTNEDAPTGGNAPDADVPPPPRREPVFNLPGIVVLLIALCAVIHAVRVTMFDVDWEVWLLIRFSFIPILFPSGYDPAVFALVAPWSYAFLHGGVAHLVVNMIWLAAFGSPLANRFGTGRFLLFWLVTSLAAIGLHYALHAFDNVPVVGASGAISGMMGAAARFAFRIDRSAGKPAFAGAVQSIPMVLRSRATVTFLVVWFVINLAMGLWPEIAGVDGGIAWEAHIGGFLAGFFLVRLFDPPARPHGP
jgi:membrane associated rhomboid family serine protease